MRALVTGGTGFIGKSLLAKLHDPVVLSRDVPRAEASLAGLNAQVFGWNPLTERAPAQAFQGVDTVFHLAGDSVADGRWTAKKKTRMRDSRILGTRNLVQTLAQLPNKPQVLVSASAIGIYGDRGDDLLTESATASNDFLADICRDWEREASAAVELGIRVVTVRTGIVLGAKGGALAKMLPPFYFGLGSPLGGGNQYMAWIHLADLVGLMLFAAEHEQLRGPVNGVAPNPVTNRQFTKALGQALHRPTFFPPVPSFMLNLMLGEFGAILLHSQRVIPRAALDAGYAFQFPELDKALKNILN